MFNLPTDNLYKFLAIFGLVIILFSAYYVDRYRRDLNHTIIDVNAEQEPIKLEIEYFEDKDKSLEGYLKDLTDRDKWMAVVDDLRKNKLELNKTIARSNANWKKMEMMDEDWLFADGWAGLIGVCIGLVLMMFGFLLWYVKAQVPLDWQMARSAWGGDENKGGEDESKSSDGAKGNGVEREEGELVNDPLQSCPGHSN